MQYAVRIIKFLLVSMAFVGYASAQTTKEELAKYPYLMCGNYAPYTLDLGVDKTPVPKGYRPFYISHYGRHGSRYHYDTKFYLQLHEIMAKADSSNALTEMGRSVMRRLERLYTDGKEKSGDLTQKGAAQHRGIAHRMVGNYPSLFRDGAKIDAKSSTTVRCVLSMEAFCMELKAMRPKVEITNESSKRLMSYIMYEDNKKVDAAMSDTLWSAAYDRFHGSLIHPSRMMRLLFADSGYVSRNIDSIAFMRKFYDVTCSLQSLDTLSVSFDDVWTFDDLYNNWRAQNAWWYGHSGPCPLTGEVALPQAKNLLTNILDEAQAVIDGRCDNVASLRFGHDMALLPLAGLMGIDVCSARTTDLEHLHEVWNEFRIIPMAGNIQLVFFRHKKNSDDILVKVLMNERAVKLPFASDCAPYYYRWADLLSYYRGILQQP